MALHPDDGVAAGDTHSPDPALCAGIPGLETKTAGRNFEAPELRRIICAGITTDHADDGGVVGLRVRGGVWRVADHNAHHLAQIIDVRRLLGIWKQ